MAQALLPQDIVVLAKLVSYGGKRPPMAQLASDLGLSSAQIHLSLRRLQRSNLVDSEVRVSSAARRTHARYALRTRRLRFRIKSPRILSCHRCGRRPMGQSAALE
jgi:predicted transcriptional regulator